METAKRMSPKKNLDLRVLALKNGVRQSDIAKYIHMSPSALSACLQKELSKAEKDEIRQAIKAIAVLRAQEAK